MRSIQDLVCQARREHPTSSRTDGWPTAFRFCPAHMPRYPTTRVSTPWGKTSTIQDLTWASLSYGDSPGFSGARVIPNGHSNLIVRLFVREVVWMRTS